MGNQHWRPTVLKTVEKKNEKGAPNMQTEREKGRGITHYLPKIREVGQGSNGFGGQGKGTVNKKKEEEYWSMGLKKEHRARAQEKKGIEEKWILCRNKNKLRNAHETVN